MMEIIYEILAAEGPVTGKELVERTGFDIFRLWRFCSSSEKLIKKIIGTRYLRLDLRVDGYARLSPSIMREFLNYTVIGLAGKEEDLFQKAGEISRIIEAISERKKNLARESIRKVIESHSKKELVLKKAVFILAGDVVYNMAHAEARPEISTGELVRGSDLDIIVVTKGLPEDLCSELDNLLYRGKYNLLVNPAVKEELDYLVKNIDLVKQQLEFNNFKEMVASKILAEGVYIGGSHELFREIKMLLNGVLVPVKLLELEKKAVRERDMAEKILLGVEEPFLKDEELTLFYTIEEKDEIF